MENKKTKNILRVCKDKDNPYVIMNKKFFEDKNLSWKAKGLLGYLLTLPDDWNIYVNDLKNRSKDGRDSTANGIKELLEAGYLDRSQKKDENNKFQGYKYTVYESLELKSRNGFSVTDNSLTGTPKLLNNNNTKYTKREREEPPPEKRGNNNEIEKQESKESIKPTQTERDVEQAKKDYTGKLKQIFLNKYQALKGVKYFMTANDRKKLAYALRIAVEEGYLGDFVQKFDEHVTNYLCSDKAFLKDKDYAFWIFIENWNEYDKIKKDFKREEKTAAEKYDEGKFTDFKFDDPVSRQLEIDAKIYSRYLRGEDDYCEINDISPENLEILKTEGYEKWL